MQLINIIIIIIIKSRPALGPIEVPQRPHLRVHGRALS